MDIEKVEAMLIEAIGKAGLPILEVEQIKKNDSMFAIAASDDSQFLIKIEKHKPYFGHFPNPVPLSVHLPESALVLQ